MRRQSGFAYLFLLFFVALLAITALAMGTVQYYEKTRSDEVELLRIGAEFRAALTTYHNGTEPHEYPASLDQLLSDQRSHVTRRHLRKIYFDPITRSQEWGLVTENGRIVGIHSLSEREPMKISGFEPDDADFEGAKHYSDWVFRADRSAIVTAGQPNQ
jgi:hypothetical protein